jgi:hypothetical protein
MPVTQTSTNPSPNSWQHLSRRQKLELRVRLEERERRRCAADAEYWLFKYARTKDEHDPSIAAKPFPDKAYIHELVRFWLAQRMNIIEKSRQMMCSWVLCSLYLWDAQFGVNRLSFLSSKKEEDSDRLIQRCFTIWTNQPDFLRRAHPAEYSFCHLKFRRRDDPDALPYSELWGIAQGPDIIRQHVGSGLFVDEGAFQLDLEALIGAAKPMLSGGGRLDIVSSASPGFFQQLVEDRVT